MRRGGISQISLIKQRDFISIILSYDLQDEER